ncbi:MAG: hypothetical protein ABI446_02410 [Gemmatimonadaceae bacterium]
MSKFNKMFIGSVVAASMLALAHTGAWAYQAARAIDASPQSKIASIHAVTSNPSLGLPITDGKASTES